MNESSPLVFPTDYPIKVVARREAGLRGRIDALVRRHVPDLDDGQVGERESAQGSYVSITYTIVARSREQVVALVTELAATDGVVMVI